jgi:hypothetical protein
MQEPQPRKVFKLRSVPAQPIEERADNRLPEHALVAAILERAILDVTNNEKVTTEKGRESQRGREKRESFKWLFHEDDSAYEFSFIHICELLGLDHLYIRRCVKRLIDQGIRPHRNTPKRTEYTGYFVNSAA